MGRRMAGWWMGISTDYLVTLVLNWTGLRRFICNLVSAKKITKPHFPQFSTFFSTDRQTNRQTDRPRGVDIEAPIPELKIQNYKINLVATHLTLIPPVVNRVKIQSFLGLKHVCKQLCF